MTYDDELSDLHALKNTINTGPRGVEHHFEDTTPAYLQVSRAGLTLHLSEHHGDACPGSTVFVWMSGIEEFHREVTAKGYKYLRPGIETTFYDSKCVEVIYPFGNRIRFNEHLRPGKAT